jgi:hypothetical protein
MIDRGKNYKCIISSNCHKVRDHVKNFSSDIYKYPLYNTSGNPYSYFSSKPHINQYDKKVIMSNSGKLVPLYDDGKLGTTQDSMYILVDTQKEGEIIIKNMNSNLYKMIIDICQWGNFRTESKLIEYFKFPTEDSDNFFDLSFDERTYIDNYFENTDLMDILLCDTYTNEIVNLLAL